MFGGLSIRGQVLGACSVPGPARVHLFDLKAKERRGGFVLAPENRGGPSRACAGLGLEASGRVVVCEPEENRVQVFSAFGHEEGSLVALPEGVVPRDRRGLPVAPQRVLLGDGGEETLLLLLGDGTWVHALQEFDRMGGFVRSYPSLGRRGEPYYGPCDLESMGQEVWILERGRSRIQMFRLGGGFLGSLDLLGFTRSSPLSFAVYPEGFFVLFEGGDLRWVDRDLRERRRLRVKPGFQRVAVEGGGVPWLWDPASEILLQPFRKDVDSTAETYSLNNPNWSP